MKKKLLEILVCRHCQNQLSLASAPNQQEIWEGELLCKHCGARFHIHKGIPQFSSAADHRAKSFKGFGYQWNWRSKQGQLSACYGLDIKPFVNWILETVQSTFNGNAIQKDDWLLDAGCGSAEKCVQLAKSNPRAQVVGLDLNPHLYKYYKTNNLPNLHMIQANLQNLPIKPGVFKFIMSIGVLHHTPDTQEVFKNLIAVLNNRGTIFTWLYPEKGEDKFWSALYRQRDIHFMGLADKIPLDVLEALCHFYVTANFWPMYAFSRFYAKKHRKVFPFSSRYRSLRGFYRSAVFTTFDNLMPEHQRRHNRNEILNLMDQCNVKRADLSLPGFYLGQKHAELRDIV